MTHKIRVLDRDVIEVAHTGDLSVKDAELARVEAAATMVEKGINLILADISNASLRDSFMNVFQFNATHCDVLPPGTRIATVMSKSMLTSTLAQFSETVAINRGVGFKIFADYSQAIAWLRDWR